MGDSNHNTMSAEHSNFAMRGTLSGHSGWVTSIVTSQENTDTILSSSRDKSEYGSPKRALTGHSHFVQDVKISSDGLFALSGSWDGTLRLWDICTGRTTRRFVGHSKDVLSVAFSVDNRQIVSASRDKSIKLWNTLGECKYTIGEQGGAEGHTEWVSCVNFVPNQQKPIHCVWRLGQDRQGLEHVQLQAPHQPCRPLRLHQRRDRLPRRFALCIRWQGRCCHALGPERGQAPLLASM